MVAHLELALIAFEVRNINHGAGKTDKTSVCVAQHLAPGLKPFIFA